jgi:hypothetical protein
MTVITMMPYKCHSCIQLKEWSNDEEKVFLFEFYFKNEDGMEVILEA